MSEHFPRPVDHFVFNAEDAAARLADTLAQWWESETGQDSYSHEWETQAERLVTESLARTDWEI